MCKTLWMCLKASQKAKCLFKKNLITKSAIHNVDIKQVTTNTKDHLELLESLSDHVWWWWLALLIDYQCLSSANLWWTRSVHLSLSLSLSLFSHLHQTYTRDILPLAFDFQSSYTGKNDFTLLIWT